MNRKKIPLSALLFLMLMSLIRRLLMFPQKRKQMLMRH